MNHSDRIRIGLVGAGSQGARHALAVSRHRQTVLTAVHDTTASRAEAISRQYGGRVCADLGGMLGEVDAVIVSSPASTHYAMAQWLVAHEVPILLEKPVCLSSEHFEQLIRAQRTKGTPLFVGMLERHNAVLDVLQRTLADRDVRAARLIRYNPDSLRIEDTDVVEDLMIHDIDLVQYVFGLTPLFTSVEGFSCTHAGSTDFAIATGSAGGAHIVLQASRTTQFYRRAIEVELDSESIVVDLKNQHLFICRFDRDGRGKRYRVDDRTDRFIEPLERQLDAFLLHLKHPNPMHGIESTSWTMRTVFDFVQRLRCPASENRLSSGVTGLV